MNARHKNFLAGLIIGISIGVAIGNLAIGIGVGVAFGAAFVRRQKPFADDDAAGEGEA